MSTSSILTINAGSSSLKLGLFAQENGDEQPIYEALADGIGKTKAKLEIRDRRGQIVHSEVLDPVTSSQALKDVAHWLTESQVGAPIAIGHRVVHGGPRLSEHQ